MFHGKSITIIQVFYAFVPQKKNYQKLQNKVLDLYVLVNEKQNA